MNLACEPQPALGVRSLAFPWRIVLLLAVLAPSAYYAWIHRDLPDFGRNHDDAIYFLSAKSLAAGEGFRLPSLPENPYQTKFPPLYPAMLAIVWKLDPAFPRNLPLAAALNWILLALTLALTGIYWRDVLPEKRVWLIVLMLGINPYFILWGCSLFSEIPVTALLVATFLAARRPGLKWAAIAGVFGGLGYLTRTAAIPLLASMPLLFFYRRERSRAVAFVAAMLPFVAAWTLWTQRHMYSPIGLDLSYYLDYLGYRRLNFGLDNIGIVVWRNLDQLLFDLGSPLLPGMFSSGPIRILTQVIGVAALKGIVRLMRRGIALDYALFSFTTLTMLIIWHFPPNERFALPLFPLVIAGLIEEFSSLAAMLREGFRHKDASQRSAAWVLASVASIVIAAGVAIQFYMSIAFLPTQSEVYRSELREFRVAYNWITANLPHDAKILSTDDPLLYSYTGHTGNALPFLSRWSYSNDREAVFRMFADIVPYCRSRGFDYVYWTLDNRMVWTGDETLSRIDQSVRENPQLTRLFSSGQVTLYKVMP